MDEPGKPFPITVYVTSTPKKIQDTEHSSISEGTFIEVPSPRSPLSSQDCNVAQFTPPVISYKRST